MTEPIYAIKGSDQLLVGQRQRMPILLTGGKIKLCNETVRMEVGK